MIQSIHLIAHHKVGPRKENEKKSRKRGERCALTMMVGRLDCRSDGPDDDRGPPSLIFTFNLSNSLFLSLDLPLKLSTSLSLKPWI